MARHPRIQYTPSRWRTADGYVINGPVKINCIISGTGLGLPTYTGRAVMTSPVELAVDGNRDGTITSGDAADQTSADHPYRFWVNDDQDNVTSLTSSGPEADVSSYVTDGETVPAQVPDSGQPNIQTVRDLEDWTRLWISLKGSSSFIRGVLNGGGSVGLKFVSKPGMDGPLPAIKICEAVETDGGAKHITDLTTAGYQITGTYDCPIQVR